MKIKYRTNKLRKCCTDLSIANKQYGKDIAIKLKMRLMELEAADNFEFLIINKMGNCHMLKGDRLGQYAMNLAQPYRLILEKHGDTIQIAEIVEIVDYH